jgi:uncharacterized protein YdiU (UPF0061 family)
MGSRQLLKRLWPGTDEIRKPAGSYSNFKKIDGTHPLRNSVDDVHVDYQARTRSGGKLTFFNFNLAREMGLIASDHPDVMNSQLEEMIMQTFSLIIINEYDILQKKKFESETIRENPFMATRYLQLQHPNKQGKTSGDGRSMWNGFYQGNNKKWDIMSCGTGATKLSPATNIQGKFFESGDPSISYGCGYSELDEALGTLFFSEVLSRNNIHTERVLAIIEFKDDIAIRVRVHPNLLRPSHFFRLLKMGNQKALRALLDYHIERQVFNGDLPQLPKDRRARYNFLLNHFAITFSKMAATFEDEYIFCWLDWDGDNILMDGGIIDYGSVRQFGLFHHEYRYDDDDRYSTSIVEQKRKAREMVKIFAQAIDFALTGKKKNARMFNHHGALATFDKVFEDSKDRNLLYKIGLTDKLIGNLMQHRRPLIQKFRRIFSMFERAKSVKGLHNVADGINWNAIFCMRDILRELPQIYLARQEKLISDDEFIEVIKSNYATAKDLELSNTRRKQMAQFQKAYNQIIDAAVKVSKVARERLLLEITMRSSVINKYERVTGDSITTIVDELLQRKKRFNPNELNSVLNEFVNCQILDPDLKAAQHQQGETQRAVRQMLNIVREYREGL